MIWQILRRVKPHGSLQRGPLFYIISSLLDGVVVVVAAAVVVVVVVAVVGIGVVVAIVLEL